MRFAFKLVILALGLTMISAQQDNKKANDDPTWIECACDADIRERHPTLVS